MENMDVLTDRLDRLEQKIDKLADAMVALARTEEKIFALESDRKNMMDRVNRHSAKIDELNDEVKENTRVTKNITKITWLVIAGLIAGFIKMFFMM